MATIIECTEGHYEAQKTSYGEACVWCPECDCGERLVLTASEAVCRCGADRTALVREELASRRVEYNDWLEWRVIE